jgi:hypothetical protein
MFAHCIFGCLRLLSNLGMRPQEIVILCKMICNGDIPWQNKEPAEALFISASEVSESLNRSMLAG